MGDVSRLIGLRRCSKRFHEYEAKSRKMIGSPVLSPINTLQWCIAPSARLLANSIRIAGPLGHNIRFKEVKTSRGAEDRKISAPGVRFEGLQSVDRMFSVPLYRKSSRLVASYNKLLSSEYVRHLG